MARIRSIKPEMRTSITVSMWPREVRYFFILLWGYLDDYGRGVDDELLIASDCFPRDRDITPERVDSWLELIADAGPLCRYEVDGRQYLHAPNWREHQKPSHPTRSKIPPCPDDEPGDFKKWREENPQRLRNRSRKSREGFAKIPEDSPAPSGSPSGGPSGAVSSEHEHDQSAGFEATGHASDESDETADHAWFYDAPESLAKSSGDAPEHFAPEQGSKGAREQGSKGEEGGGCGSTYSLAPARVSATPPVGDAPIDIDGFELTDAMRAWSLRTFGPNLDLDYETSQFVDHFRAQGVRRPNWPAEWQKWIRRSAKYASERANRPQAHGNVIALPSGQTLTGTDAKVAGWMAIAEQLRQEGDPA